MCPSTWRIVPGPLFRTPQTVTLDPISLGGEEAQASAQIVGGILDSSEFYQRFVNLYPLERPAGEHASPHEMFSALDFKLRFLSIIANSVLRSSDEIEAPKIGRSPGLGAWVSYLRVCRDTLGQSRGEASKLTHGAVDSALTAYDGGIDMGISKIRTPKKLRDHLGHGGALPPYAEVSEPLRGLLDSVDVAIEKLLGATGLVLSESNGSTRASFKFEDREVSTWPLIFSPTTDEWCIFSRYVANGRPSYFSFGTDRVEASSIPDNLGGALNRILDSTAPRGALGAFKEDVTSDLRGFTEELEEDLTPGDRDHGFEVWWKKATGTGIGFEERVDYFRLGPDDMRQWRSPEKWVPYSRYLREIANWPLTARRIRIALEEHSRKLASQEVQNLGWRLGGEGQYRESSLLVTDLDGSNRSESSFSDLLNSVDEDLQANRPQTQVVFVNGEAGIGKTRAMIGAALHRARTIEEEAGEHRDSDLPLLLYVGSSGQVLSQLDNVIAAAVSSTRSITAAAVKALCRNGLMALLVDGFDELLGNVRYNDALGSLRPWLEDMGGRGVLMVSARSSYYVGQYKASVRRAHEGSAMSVHHKIAEIQLWKARDIREVLTSYGVDPSVLVNLSEEDRQLLRLPFFTRAFIEMCLSEEAGIPTGTSLPEHLLDQYLTREEGKILDESGRSVISHRELKTMFSYVAELMEENSEREADDELLRTAAMFTIDDSLESRTGLAERLPNLCGFATTTSGGAQLRFKFQHELFFDQFLADAVSRYLGGSEVSERFKAMLGSSVWRTATVNRVGSSVSIDRLSSVLGGDFADGETAARRSTAALNVGSLWQTLISRSKSMDWTIRSADLIDPLDLSGSEPGVMVMSNVKVESLVLPRRTGWRISLQSTRIRRIHAQILDFSGLSGVDASAIVEILTPNRLIEKPSEIRDVLEKYGARLVDAGPTPEERNKVLPEAATFFLRRAIDRGEYFWVLKRNHRTPDDDLLARKRTEDVYGREVWLAFIKAMLDSGLAVEESIARSGSAKIRVRLLKNGSDILGEDRSDERVRDFWRRMMR